MRLRALAPGKVNLCLWLGGVLADGRHELVTLFESVSLADELTMTTLAAGEPDQVICLGVPGVNLVTTALAGLRTGGWSAPGVRVEVVKRVPVAAGMGGGSADAAATLRLAAELAPVSPSVVQELAVQLGADVPSQLQPGLALGTGAGHLITPLPPLAPHAFLILPQPTPLSTAEVFREADRLGLPRSADQLSSFRDELQAALDDAADGSGGRGAHAGPGPGGIPPRLLVNDLEPAAVSLHPPIRGALALALEAGAEHAFVCGSGPTVAGLFWGSDALDRATVAADSLAGRFPGAVSAVPVDGAAASPQFV